MVRLTTIMEWKMLINQELERNNSVCGTCLILRRNTVVHASGCLKDLNSQHMQQFINVFRCSSEKHTKQLYDTGFNLSLNERKNLKFNIFYKSLTSVYASCLNGELGLVVCYLPYGVLVCMHDTPLNSGSVINTIEKFCAKLRS